MAIPIEDILPFMARLFLPQIGKTIHYPADMLGALDKILQPYVLVGGMGLVTRVAYSGRNNWYVTQRLSKGVYRAAAASKRIYKWCLSVHFFGRLHSQLDQWIIGR